MGCGSLVFDVVLNEVFFDGWLIIFGFFVFLVLVICFGGLCWIGLWIIFFFCGGVKCFCLGYVIGLG